MKIPLLFAAIALAFGAAGCTPRAEKPATSPAAAAVPGSEPCADDGPRFAGTGLCVGRSVNYLDPARLDTKEGLPDGCSWEMNETLLPGDEALLYQALSCKGKKTELEFRGGAKTATLGVRQSGFFETVRAEYEPVRILSLFEVADPKARILAFAREGIENPEESAACEVSALEDGAPSDAFVVDANADYKAKKKLVEGPGPGQGYAVCGPYGYSSDANQYWRITGGYAFFFDLGQDLPDFNPNSLTVIRKGADGSWVAVK